MSQGKTRQVPELLKYCGIDFPTATSSFQTFDCPVIKIFFDGIKFALFETVLSGWKRLYFSVNFFDIFHSFINKM